MAKRIRALFCAFLLVLCSVCSVFSTVQASEEQTVGAEQTTVNENVLTEETEADNPKEYQEEIYQEEVYQEETQVYAAKSGLIFDSDNIWRYYENGQVASSYTGLVEYWGTWYYIENGVLNWGYTGLTEYYGTWYYVEQGRLNWGYTGLTEYYGTWYYVEQGRLNWGYTGLTQYYGVWYYVQQGRLNWNYTGLTQYYGVWYYVEQGRLNWNFTGLTDYYDVWYYVQGGILNWNFSGTVQWEDENWKVVNGIGVEKLAKHIVCIDAGHQAYGMSQKEPNGPGSSVMKAMLTTGAVGVATGQKEYELNLAVALKLKTELLNRGYQVVMIREDNNCPVSNAQRAVYANNSGAEIFVRIHANSSANTAVRGAMAYGPSSANPYMASGVVASSQALTNTLLNQFCATTGLVNKGVLLDDTMTGINWCTIPVTIIEMGFLSNPDEDRLMATDSFRDVMARGIADGIDTYFGR